MIRPIFSLALTGALLASAEVGAQVASKLDWLTGPSAEQRKAAIPPAAKRADEDGLVVLDCELRQDGATGACTVKLEAPAGLGYGEAALRLARSYRLDRDAPGQRNLARVTLPVEFRLHYTPPSWVRRPSPADLASVWPEEAVRRRKDGKAVIGCEVTLEGTLRACRVVAEEPAGLGYGPAALALAPTFLLSPAKDRGQPVPGESVTIPVSFSGAADIEASTRFLSLSNPMWTAAPTRAEVAAAYPAKARRDGVQGLAAMDCEVTPAGGLRKCESVSENPMGKGFGRAAVSLAPRFQLQPPVPRQGVPPKVKVRVPVAFSPGTDDGRQIVKPEWGRLPGAEQVEFPPEARVAKAQGAVTLACVVATGGVLEGCTVAEEAPAGLGFGAAALALAQHFRMKAWTSDGRPVDGAKVRIPVTYQNPES